MMICDAQVHIWAADSPARPWPSYGHSYAHRETPFTRKDLIAEMDAAGVDRVIIVPPSWEGERNDLALEAAPLHPTRCAIMGRTAAPGAVVALAPGATAIRRRPPKLTSPRTHFTEENEVGCKISFVTLVSKGPFASVCARALIQSGSAPNLAHFCSRSASDSQATI